MIFTDRIITVRKGESKINEPIIVYRGDYELEVRFTIMNSKFKFMSGTNLIESENAAYGQLAILTPYGGNIFSDVAKCNDGTVTFVLTKEMLDQIEEVGLYSFQIRLFDYIKESRISIPPVEFGIEVREPITSEDHDNSVNNAIVGYSIAKIADALNEKVPDTFDADGQYNKTDWKTGDRITEGKLNKIEDAIDTINQNEINDKNTLNKQMTSNFNVLQSQIDNMVIESGNTDAEVEQARGNYDLLNQRLNAMDETDAELVSQLEVANSQLEQKANYLEIKEEFDAISDKNVVYVTDYGMDKTGVECCSDIFIDVVNHIMDTKKKIYFPSGVYKFTKPISISQLQDINLLIEGESSSEGTNHSTRLEYWGEGVFLTFDGLRTLKLKNIDIVGKTDETSKIYNEGTTAIISSNSINMCNCTVGGFETICNWNGGYYHTFDNIYIYYTNLAFKNFDSNNLRFNRIKVNRIARFLTTNSGSGPISITNSSFERFTGILMTASSGNAPSINISNCYFENYLEDTNVPSQLGTQYLGRVLYGYNNITLVSNTIFAKGISRFVYDNGNLRSLMSIGNLIKYAPSNSAMTEFIYHTNKLESVICNDSAINDLQGDGDNIPIYINSISVSQTLRAGACFIYNPFTKQYYDRNVATTANRPTNGLYQGYSLYDTTLRKPIWYTGEAWVDANGDTI